MKNKTKKQNKKLKSKFKQISLKVVTSFSEEENTILNKIFATNSGALLTAAESKLFKKKTLNIERINQEVLEGMLKVMAKVINKYPDQARYIVPNLITLFPKVLYDSIELSEFKLKTGERKLVSKMLKDLGEVIEPDEIRYIG